MGGQANVGGSFGCLSTSFRHPAQPLPYVAAWHQAPVSDPLREHAFLHLQVSSIQRAADKLEYLAGSETGMGAFITDVLPGGRGGPVACGGRLGRVL